MSSIGIHSPPDVGKIRHFETAQNTVALYAVPEWPYYSVLPVIGWSLLTRDGVDHLEAYVAATSPEAVPARMVPGVLIGIINLSLCLSNLFEADYGETPPFELLRQRAKEMGYQMSQETDDAESR